MSDAECVSFLQWALPRLGMRWAGFRKVRRQVCKRVGRRMAELRLPDVSAYRAYLESHPGEWGRLDTLCRITISRFYRDRGVFEYLATDVLPGLARRSASRADPEIRAWSIGCAGGEEVYSLTVLWRLAVQPRFPTVRLRVLGTDIDERQLARAEAACFPAGALKEVPAEWIETAFERAGRDFRVRGEYRSGVEFRSQDIRREMPGETFDVVLCRNIVFTYLEEILQREIAGAVARRIRPDGVLIVGNREVLPSDTPGFTALSTRLRIYGKGVAAARHEGWPHK